MKNKKSNFSIKLIIKKMMGVMMIGGCGILSAFGLYLLSLVSSDILRHPSYSPSRLLFYFFYFYLFIINLFFYFYLFDFIYLINL